MSRKLLAMLVLLFLDLAGSLAVLYDMMPLNGFAQALVGLLPMISILNLILAAIASRRRPWLSGPLLLNALLAPMIFFGCFDMLNSG